MSFNHSLDSDRVALSSALENKMLECGFTEDFNSNASERVFERRFKDTNTYIKVYTTIYGNRVRPIGRDAIRVFAVYKGNKGNRTIASSSRTNRVGSIEDIVMRTHDKMREVWKECSSRAVCNFCGAPKFASKKGNEVCAEACWAKVQ